MNKEDLNAAGVAQLAGVSRAAVSKWFHQQGNWINVETTTLRNLASSLGITPDIFLRETPDLTTYQTEFLWDRLYPSMEAFVEALGEHRLPAMARLAQVIGFHQSLQLIGKKAVTEFEKYKKHIKPVRRKQLETVWPLYRSHR